MRLCDVLKKLRIDSGLTQKQLAQKTGISYHSINSYESGRREPSSKAMATLERFFGVSGEYLRGEIDTVDFHQNNNHIQNELDNVINEFLQFKENFHYATQSKQDEASRTLEKMISYINNNLLPDFSPSGSGDFITKFIDAYPSLNEEGIRELLKRLDELLQLSNYLK